MKGVLRIARDMLLKAARILAEINTRILLTAVFFLVITPLGLFFRPMGKSPLAVRQGETMWTPRDGKSGPGRPF